MLRPQQVFGRTLRARVAVVFGSLLLLLLAVVASTFFVRLQVQASDNRVSRVLVPAQDAATGLETAYVDQETGERGYVQTGQPVFLQTYTSGRSAAETYADKLTTALRGDRTGLRLLARVEAAARTWTSSAAEPQIAARQAGILPPGEPPAQQLLQDTALFNQLRSDLAALTSHISHTVGGDLAAVRSAQAVANYVALAAILAAVAVSAAAVLVLRRSLGRPVSRLLGQVQAVANGALDHPVHAAGPTEVAAVADAVERMRTRILADTRAAARAREELARYAEGDRIAQDLHDRVIQRLFATGMRLESEAGRHPEWAPVAAELVADLDRSIRELRTVIFGLTVGRTDAGLLARISAVITQSGQDLGFTPILSFSGPLETEAANSLADEAVPALTGMLRSLSGRANGDSAEVHLEARDGVLRLRVSDPGKPDAPDPLAGGGLADAEQRARSLGGSFSISTSPTGTTILEWAVPTG